ncbi:MAG: LacI family DNA-binding transcriptional regulator [Verrucomicrobiia bacterium]
MIRLKDVAERAGVSLMTVSKVLRDKPDVSQATKTRIRRLVEEMGYVPNALARGLRTRRTRLLALVLPSLESPALGQIAAAVQSGAFERGYELLVAQTADDPEREETSLRRLLSRGIDGLVIFPVARFAPSVRIYDELRASRIPVVLLGPRAPFCAAFPNVEMDDAAASCRVTQHLIALGHRRVAFFAGPPAASWAQQRLEGYRRALRDAGIPWDDRLVFTSAGTIAAGEQTALQMLSESTNTTAVQTVSDLAALGAANAFFKAGMRIPDDLSLAGFGNDPVAEHGRVPLTTVQQPNEMLGAAAVDSLTRILAGGAPRVTSVPAQLVLRNSTGVPRQNPPLPAMAVAKPEAVVASAARRQIAAS